MPKTVRKKGPKNTKRRNSVKGRKSAKKTRVKRNIISSKRKKKSNKSKKRKRYKRKVMKGGNANIEDFIKTNKNIIMYEYDANKLEDSSLTDIEYSSIFQGHTSSFIDGINYNSYVKDHRVYISWKNVIKKKLLEKNKVIWMLCKYTKENEDIYNDKTQSLKKQIYYDLFYTYSESNSYNIKVISLLWDTQQQKVKSDIGYHTFENIDHLLETYKLDINNQFKQE